MCRVYGFVYDYTEKIRSIVGQDYKVFGLLTTNDIVITCNGEREFVVVFRNGQYINRTKESILNIFGPVAIKDLPPASIVLHMNILHSRHRIYFELRRKEVTLDQFVRLLEESLN